MKKSIITRSRKGHRNGYKSRTLNTRLGKLGFEVPQVRGTEPYQPMFFERWQRSERALLATCAEMYFMGVSTRKVGRVLEQMGGFSLSAATVSTIVMELDEKLTEFRCRALGDRTWPYLIVDARYEKVRHAGRIVSRAVLRLGGRHRRRLHSTNMLERLMREIKRRTRVVGIFPNEASCDRLVGAMLIEYHETCHDLGLNHILLVT